MERVDGDDSGIVAEAAARPEAAAAAGKSLGVWNGVSFIVGTMIGSGIFASPGSVLLQSHSVGMALLAWVAAGVIALMGAASYAELGTALPANGGECVW